jgi:hypothetical protein
MGKAERAAYKGYIKTQSLLSNPKRRWDDNSKLHVKEIDLENGYRFVWFTMRINGKFCDYGTEFPVSTKRVAFRNQIAVSYNLSLSVS